MAFRLGRLFASALLLALMASGCSPEPSEVDPPEAPASEAPAVMPDLVGRDMSEVQKILGPLAGNVEIVFPARIATRTVEPKVTLRPPESHIETLEYPARTLTLNADVQRHEVASQSPVPGEPLGRDTAIVLTPARHPGEAVGPWIYAHADAVARDGANTCFPCHDPTGCSDCHLSFE